MCNCKEDRLKLLREHHSEWKGKPVESINFLGGILTVEDSRLIPTTSNLEIKVEGRKTPFIVRVAHSYCPWCGKKYREDEG